MLPQAHANTLTLCSDVKKQYRPMGIAGCFKLQQQTLASTIKRRWPWHWCWKQLCPSLVKLSFNSRQCFQLLCIFFPTALFVNLRIWFQLCELMFFPHWLCICEFVSNSAACFKLQAPTNQINCCVQLSPLFVIRKFKYKIKHTFSNKYSNTQAQNSGVEIKTSQELRMLSRSLSDCKSLLLNIAMSWFNLNRCLCSHCSDCSQCLLVSTSVF